MPADPRPGHRQAVRVGMRSAARAPAAAETPAASPDAFQLPGASEALRELAARGVRHAYRRGRLLIEEGDEGGTIYIVCSGRLRVFAADPASGREVTFGSYGPGEYVGEMSLDGGLRSANVEALEPSECVLVTRPTLEAFIAEYPAFAFELLSKVIGRARAATLSTRQMALNNVYGRLRALLETMAEEQGDGTRVIAERLTHKDIASRIGCTREMVSRLMKDLERGGYVVPHPEPDGKAGGPALILRRALPQRW